MDWGLFASIVGAVAGVAAIPTGLLVARRQEARPQLDYRIEAATALLTDESEDVQVRVGGNVLTRPRLMLITVVNSSRKAVRASAYATPITFEFPNGKIASVGIAHEQVSDCASPGPVLVDPSTVTVTPELLNASDEFTVRFIVDGSLKKSEIKCRFEGQLRPMRNMTGLRLPVVQSLIGGGLTGVGLALFVGSIYSLFTGTVSPKLALAAGFTTIVCVELITSIYFFLRWRIAERENLVSRISLQDD